MLPDGSKSGKPATRSQRAAFGFRALLRAARLRLPEPCLACGGRATGAFCDDCFRELPWNDHACPRCAARLPGPLPGLCGECIRRRPAFDAAYAAFVYAWPVDRFLQEFKYHGRLATGRALAQTLIEYLAMKGAPKPDVLVPVPLHPGRLSERGFNQASELARTLARGLGTAADAALIRRRRPTRSQQGLGGAERRGNVRGAFACRRRVDDLHVAVVDDVMTTGSTADAVAKALRRSGAAAVSVYTVARA